MKKGNAKRFSRREAVLLAVLAAMILGLCYFKFFLEPLRVKTEDYRSRAEAESSETLRLQSRVAKVLAMRKVIEEARTGEGAAQVIPAYDNSKPVVAELNRILADSTGYSLSFGVLSRNDYIVERPISIRYSADDYASARSILSQLNSSAFMNMISDVSLSDSSASASRSGEKAGYSVDLKITYFEVDG